MYVCVCVNRQYCRHFHHRRLSSLRRHVDTGKHQAGTNTCHSAPAAQSLAVDRVHPGSEKSPAFANTRAVLRGPAVEHY